MFKFENLFKKTKGEKDITPEKKKMRDLEKDLNDPGTRMQTPEDIVKERKAEDKRLEEGIKTASTIDDLIALFEQTSGIMTSNGLCSSKKMIEILELAKDDPDSAITYITRNLGLRDKVKEIVKMRNLEQDLNDPKTEKIL